MNTKLKYISLTVLVVVILTFIVLVGLIISVPDLPTTNGKNEICLSNKDEEIVCGSTETILHHYLDEVISKRYTNLKNEDRNKKQKYLDDKKKNKGSLDKSVLEAKPAARITGKDKHEKRTGVGVSGMQSLTDNEWTYGRELRDSNGFLRHGVRYKNGRLVVPVDGTYFVYSMVDFFETCDQSTGIPNVKDLNNPIKHAIYKFNILDKAEIGIIANVQPHQMSSNKNYNSYSSFVSSITNLKTGDEISVKVSNITYIIYTKDNSFGLNLI